MKSLFAAPQTSSDPFYKQKVQAYVTNESIDILDEADDKFDTSIIHFKINPCKEDKQEKSFFSPTRRFSGLDSSMMSVLNQHLHEEQTRQVQQRPISLPKNKPDNQIPFLTVQQDWTRPPLNKSYSANVVSPTIHSSSTTIASRFNGSNNNSLCHEMTSTNRSFSHASSSQKASPMHTANSIPQAIRPTLIRAHSSPTTMYYDASQIQKPHPHARLYLHHTSATNVANNAIPNHDCEESLTDSSTSMSVCSLSPCSSSTSTPLGTSPHNISPFSLQRPVFKRSTSHSHVYHPNITISSSTKDDTCVNNDYNILMESLRQVSSQGSPAMSTIPVTCSAKNGQHDHMPINPHETSNVGFAPPPLRKAFSTNTVFKDRSEDYQSAKMELYRFSTNVSHDLNVESRNDPQLHLVQRNETMSNGPNMLPSLNQLFGQTKSINRHGRGNLLPPLKELFGQKRPIIQYGITEHV